MVDTSKGDKEKPEYRCRLVSKEIKNDKREDLFAATPPLVAKKLFFSLFASSLGLCLDVIDVARSYFHAKARRRARVDLPKQDHQDGMRGRLKKEIHGARDTSQNRELVDSEMKVEAGFAQGSYSPCVFYREDKDGRAGVRGGGFTVLGSRGGLD